MDATGKCEAQHRAEAAGWKAVTPEEWKAAYGWQPQDNEWTLFVHPSKDGVASPYLGKRAWYDLTCIANIGG